MSLFIEDGMSGTFSVTALECVCCVGVRIVVVKSVLYTGDAMFADVAGMLEPWPIQRIVLVGIVIGTC